MFSIYSNLLTISNKVSMKLIQAKTGFVAFLVTRLSILWNLSKHFRFILFFNKFIFRNIVLRMVNIRKWIFSNQILYCWNMYRKTCNEWKATMKLRRSKWNASRLFAYTRTGTEKNRYELIQPRKGYKYIQNDMNWAYVNLGIR